MQNRQEKRTSLCNLRKPKTQATPRMKNKSKFKDQNAK
jgi:hypothetical protein